MGSRVVPPGPIVNLHQLDVNFWKVTTAFEHLSSKQDTESDSLMSEDFTLAVIFWRNDVMMTLWYIITMIAMHIVEQ